MPPIHHPLATHVGVQRVVHLRAPAPCRWWSCGRPAPGRSRASRSSSGSAGRRGCSPGARSRCPPSRAPAVGRPVLHLVAVYGAVVLVHVAGADDVQVCLADHHCRGRRTAVTCGVDGDVDRAMERYEDRLSGRLQLDAGPRPRGSRARRRRVVATREPAIARCRCRRRGVPSTTRITRSMWPRSRAHRSRISSAESTGRPRRASALAAVRRSREQISPGVVASRVPSTAAKTGSCSGSFGSAQPRSLAPVRCVNRAPSGSTAGTHGGRGGTPPLGETSLSRRNSPWLTRRNPSQAQFTPDGLVSVFLVRHCGERAQAASRNCAPRRLWMAAWVRSAAAVWSPTAGNRPNHCGW